MEPLTEIPDEAPTVTSEPQNLIVDEGEPATFTCKIKGSPGMLRLLRCEKWWGKKKFNFSQQVATLTMTAEVYLHFEIVNNADVLVLVFTPL